MKVIGFLLRTSRGVMILAIVAGIVSGASSTGLLALINGALAKESSRAELLPMFLALCLIVPLSRTLAELLLAHLGQETILRLRMDLSRGVLRLPLRRLEEIGPHRILSTLTDDVPTVTNVVGQVPVLCINAAIFIGGLIYLAWLSGPIFLGVLVLMAVGIVGYQLPMVKGVALMRQARDLGDDLFHHFRALTEGAKELKLHGERRESFLSGELEGTARKVRDRNLRGIQIYTLAASWGQLLVFVVIGVLIFAPPDLTRADSTTLTGYTLTLLYLMAPLQVALNSIPSFSRASVALDRVERMGLRLSESNAEQIGGRPVTGLPAWSRIELDGVTHSYQREGEEGHFVLGPVDLTIFRGEILFIAGGNGSGKTTLAKILTGLYTPAQGEILLDGQPVDDSNREAYRQRFSAVFSDFFLFRNLLGLEASDLDDQVNELLVRLQLQKKVKVTKGALSSTDLSSGQRKRLALLTAYLENREVYLFDEWAADQDPYFREVFYRELLPNLKAAGKTVLVISHDERYFGVGDRLIKLDNGTLVAEGRSHAETEAVLEKMGVA